MPAKLRHTIKRTLAGACAALFIFPDKLLFLVCLSAGTSKANYRVYCCIQSAADASLGLKDQLMAAAIIRNLANWFGPFVPGVKVVLRGYRSTAK